MSLFVYVKKQWVADKIIGIIQNAKSTFVGANYISPIFL